MHLAITRPDHGGVDPVADPDALGSGGFGSVRAVVRADGRRVAIKRVADPAATMGWLLVPRHPSILRTLRVETLGPITEIETELIDGVDLRGWRGSAGALAEIVTQVCAGIGAAHDRGVVHGDLKPANIMITPPGRVVIIDWDLAVPAGTRRRLCYATPQFAAPEQVCGDPLTGATDVYQLGGLIYTLATGRSPRSSARTSAECREWAVEGIMDPRTLADLTAMGPLGRLIARCLDPDPRMRPGVAEIASAMSHR